MKTCSTLPSLLRTGEDFEDWFSDGCGLDANEFIVCSIQLQEQLPTLAVIRGIVITDSPAFVTDLAPWKVWMPDALLQKVQPTPESASLLSRFVELISS